MVPAPLLPDRVAVDASGPAPPLRCSSHSSPGEDRPPPRAVCKPGSEAHTAVDGCHPASRLSTFLSAELCWVPGGSAPALH